MCTHVLTGHASHLALLLECAWQQATGKEQHESTAGMRPDIHDVHLQLASATMNSCM